MFSVRVDIFYIHLRSEKEVFTHEVFAGMKPLEGEKRRCFACKKCEQQKEGKHAVSKHRLTHKLNTDFPQIHAHIDSLVKGQRKRCECKKINERD